MAVSQKRLLNWIIFSGLVVGLCVIFAIVLITGRLIETAFEVLALIAKVQSDYIIDSLNCGTSETRISILNGLLTKHNETLVEQPDYLIDSQFTAWILPALENCKGDCDPKVTELAFEFQEILKKYNSFSPK